MSNSRTQRIAGLDVHLTEANGQASVCFVHGLGDRGARFTPLVDSLVGLGITSAWFDLPGCGENKAVSFDPETVARTIEGVFNHFDQATTRVLVGHSLGGLLTSSAVVRGAFPQGKMLFVEASLTPVDLEFFRFVERAPYGKRIEGLRQFCVENPQAAPVDYVSFLDTWRQEAFEACVDFALSTLTGPIGKILDALPRCTYVYGRQSRGDERRAYLSRYPNLNLVEFAHSSHWPMMQETERFIELVTEMAGGRSVGT